MASAQGSGRAGTVAGIAAYREVDVFHLAVALVQVQAWVLPGDVFDFQAGREELRLLLDKPLDERQRV
jgi:hypothetical protein